jgi:hypothetical protein
MSQQTHEFAYSLHTHANLLPLCSPDLQRRGQAVVARLVIFIGSLVNCEVSIMNQHSVEAVVANTIHLTELLLSMNQVSWEDARAGIEFIREDLARKRPADCETIRDKFDAWLCAQNSRSALILPFPARCSQSIAGS